MDISDFLLQIVLFAAGAGIGVGTVLIQNNHKLLKALFIALAGLMIISSLLWAGFELSSIATAPTPNTPTDALPAVNQTPYPTSESLPPTNLPSVVLPTPLYSILDAYDSFDKTESDGQLTQSLWNRNELTDEVIVLQENGRLKFTALGFEKSADLWIEPRITMSRSLADYNAIQGDFSWEAIKQGQIFFGLTLSSSNGLWKGYSCDFAITNVSSGFYCHNHDNHRSEAIWLNPGETHNVMIEFAKNGGVFYAYLDGKLIDKFMPPNSQDWLTTNITYDIHFSCPLGCNGITYLDNVRVGQPIP